MNTQPYTNSPMYRGNIYSANPVNQTPIREENGKNCLLIMNVKDY